MSGAYLGKGREALVEGVSSRLVALRKRAGMTQQAVAEAMGKPRSGKMPACRLEHGGVESASLGTLAEYLRAIRAGFSDLKEVLDRYTSLPIPEPQRRRAAAAPLPRVLTGSRALACLPGEAAQHNERVRTPDREEELRVLRVRRRAGYWDLRRLFEFYLHSGLKGASIPVNVRFRRVIATYARRYFNALYRTHRAPEGKRTERLARLRESAKRYALPAAHAEHAEAIAELAYNEMCEHEEIDWMPAEAEARAVMSVKPKHRAVTDYQMCMAEWAEVSSHYNVALMAIYERPHEAALDVVGSARCDGRTLVRYRQAALRAANIARTTAPDTARRKQSVRDWHATDWPAEVDRRVLDRMLATALATWDALLPTLPPAPGPRPV